MLRCSYSHSSTLLHGPHLVGLVEEAASAPLEQELNVLINTAARKLSGQIVSAFKITHIQSHKDGDRVMARNKIHNNNCTILFYH